MSDVPLGAMLSGGLDSSLIVALMARHMSEPLETFAVGFAGEDSELPDARRVADALGANHHELEVELQSDPAHLSRPDLAPRRAARRPVLARLPVALRAGGRPRHRRPLRPGRRRAVRRLSQAPRRLAGRDAGAGCPARLRGPAAAALRRGPGRAGRLAEALQAGDPVERLLASSGFVRPDLRGQLFGGALAEHAGRRRAGRARHARRRARRGAAGGRALHGRPARARRRHAHVLRPRVDGLLARGPRAVPRPRAGRAVRDDPDRAQGAPPPGQARPAARLAGPACRTSCLAKRKRGFFNESVAELDRRRRRRRRSTTCCSGATPPTPQVVDPTAVRRAVVEWRVGAGRTTRSCCSGS